MIITPLAVLIRAYITFGVHPLFIIVFFFLKLTFYFFDGIRCISEKKCQVPSCDHGHYITFIGRCPRREEKSQSWLRLLVS